MPTRDELQRATHRLKTLKQIDQAILAAGSPAEIAHAALERIRQLVPYEIASLTIFDPPAGQAEIIAIRSYIHAPKVEIESAGTRIELSLFEPFEELQPGQVRLFRQDEVPDEPLGERMRAGGQQITMNVPLITDDELIGTINMGSPDPEAFDPESQAIVLEVADSLAIAIRQARLQEQVERHAAELEERVAELDRLKARLEQENVYLKEEIRTRHNFAEIIGESASLQKVFRAIETVAPTDANVLLTGETGTGKELVARALHDLSPRRHQPLVKVNCAALPAGLVESELFGHERGAFTGAVHRKAGRFELAHDGTLFLDEIGDLPLDLQAKMLRVLQEGELERLGGTRTYRVDTRVIAATNRNLEQAVAEGRFRSDLYYRLKVFPIELPPLRDRPGDVPLLTQHFVRKFAQRFGRTIESIPRAAMESLSDYAWPGNVRELENVIERAVILSSGPELRLGDERLAAAPVLVLDGERPPQTLDEVQKEHILKTLKQFQWRVSGPHGAARILGLKPTTLEARMKKLGIRRPT